MIALGAATVAWCVVAGGAVPQAQAAVTVGSPLIGSGVVSQSCFGPAPCVTTIVQEQLASTDQASPISGVIVRWRVRDASGQLQLRVLQNDAGPTWTGIRTGDVATIPAGDFVTVVPARLPIAAGQYVALDIHGTATVRGRMSPAVDLAHQFGGGGVLNGTPRSPNSSGDTEYFFNADIEPDADADGFGDETQDGCPGEAGPDAGCPAAAPTDAAPPDTTITKRPKDKTKKKTATFEFAGTDVRALSGFQCSLDGAAYAACASPFTVKVKKGKHTFSVRATDLAGNADASPATDSWKVKKKKRRG